MGLGGSITGIRPEPAKIDLFDDKHVIKVHAGEYHSLALTSSGEVYSWGSNSNGQLGLDSVSERYYSPVKIGGIPKIKALAAGSKHTLLLSEAGDVYSFGGNEYGQLGIGTTQTFVRVPTKISALNKITAISMGAGGNSTKAVRYDGSV